jgi:hypothetical protein
VAQAVVGFGATPYGDRGMLLFVPAYLVWGAGMAVAATAYTRETRRACEACGRNSVGVFEAR